MTVPPDYDSDPERFRLGSRVTGRHLAPGWNLYTRIVTVLTEAGAGRVLDIGCGEGALSAAARQAVRVVGLDASMTMLAAHPGPAVRGDAVRLPFRDGVFGAAVAVNVLYHLDDPSAALREARRVLAPGGLLVAAAIARDDSPELARVWRRAPTPFDAEDAPGLVGAVFGAVEVERWDAPLLLLPDRAAVRDYLVARLVPRAEAETLAARVGTPLRVTKRGALVLARR
ncbi:class I SAM-dependent methyltransferase [Actinomadura kijaniata]|uniref:class I SAM-dependent methyltransferase n=1 Tax=Actinomadura kijaniata TaxID=46161 RepID=UPI003F197AB6